MRIIFVIITLIVASNTAYAQQHLVKSVSYYASLRGNETNVRAGPGQNYPIKFTYKIRGVPIHVVSEFDNWYEIEDYQKHTGWVMQNLVTKKRSLMVTTKKPMIDMYRKNNEKSRLVFHLKNHVIADYVGCDENWCAAKVNGKKGWIKRSELYGSDDE